MFIVRATFPGFARETIIETTSSNVAQAWADHCRAEGYQRVTISETTTNAGIARDPATV